MSGMLRTLAAPIFRYILFHYRARWLYIRFMASPLVARNPLYTSAYRRNVARLRPLLERAPISLRVENTNFCNLECCFCPYPTMTRPKGTMSATLYQRIVDEAATMGVRELNLLGFGEPLVDRHFAERIRYARDKGIPRVSTSTNGLLLQPSVASALLQSGLYYINISVDAATKHTYQELHGMDGLATLEANVRCLLKQREEEGKKNPIVSLSFHKYERNQQDLRLFVSKYKKLADCLSVVEGIHQWTGNRMVRLLGPSGIRFPCVALWTAPQVWWDGRVSMCCQDYDAQFVIGDLNKESLAQVWQSPRLAEIRQSHLRGDFGQVALCRDCGFNYNYRQPWWTSEDV